MSKEVCPIFFPNGYFKGSISGCISKGICQSEYFSLFFERDMSKEVCSIFFPSWVCKKDECHVVCRMGYVNGVMSGGKPRCYFKGSLS